MGQAKMPQPVKLIASLFAASEEALTRAEALLVERFGPVDYRSQLLPFDHTDYYTPEFGTPLVRRFLAFAKLIDPTTLPAIKHVTNELERARSPEGRRWVNVDPGYLSLGKLVLATTKDHAHRLYLGQGIYGEVTLYYHKGSFRAWPWTYPDYASPSYIALFNDIRTCYREQLRILQKF